MQPPVVIIGLASSVGLQSARVLARRGISVVGIAASRGHYGARTRSCARVVVAEVQSPSLIDTLDELAGDLPAGTVLLPCTDTSALLVAEYADRLRSHYRWVLPSYPTLHGLADKGRFASLMSELGVRTPRTRSISSPVDAQEAARELRFPVVLKPHVRSALWWGRANSKVELVRDAGELLIAHERLHRWTSQLIAQEFVPGGDDALYTCNCFYGHSGELRVMFTTRKRRQWPPSVGIASYATEWRDDELVALARRIFESVGFRGLGYLEAKRHAHTGELVVIEANVGRPTGRSSTAEAAGVPLLWTMYCEAAGLPLPSESQRRQPYVGAAWLDLRRDALACCRLVRRGELSVGGWLATWVRPRTAHAVFSWRDPLPFVTDLGQSARRAVRRSLASPPSPGSRGDKDLGEVPLPRALPR